MPNHWYLYLNDGSYLPLLVAVLLLLVAGSLHGDLVRPIKPTSRR